MVKDFEDWDDAFSYCREKNYPVIVKVKGEFYKIFPSGRCEKLDRKENS